MTSFVYEELVPQDDIISTALGASTSAKFVSADVDKAVKLAASQNYVPVVSGDEIEAFVVAVEPFTVNGGFSFGSVCYSGRKRVTAGGTIALGGLVVSGTPVALGTAGKAVVIAGTPTKYLWRMVRNITNPGNAAATGNEILVERLI